MRASNQKRWLVVVLATAILAISFAPILVRSVGEMTPITIAFWRTLGAFLLLAPYIRRIGRLDAMAVALAGIFLALHFVTWFTSLNYTTILRSTVLTCVSPVWVGLFEWAFLKSRPARGYWIGVCAAVPGISLMADPSEQAGSLFGDGLALLAGILAAVYFTIGKAVRPRVPFGSYASLVCGAAAVLLLPMAPAFEQPLLGFSWTDWVLVAGLAIGPQLLGHNGLNFALRYMPAAKVSALVLLEPVGAAILAILLFGEWPTPRAAIGATIVVAGVIWAALHPNRDPKEENPAEEAADPNHLHRHPPK